MRPISRLMRPRCSSGFWVGNMAGCRGVSAPSGPDQLDQAGLDQPVHDSTHLHLVELGSGRDALHRVLRIDVTDHTPFLDAEIQVGHRSIGELERKIQAGNLVLQFLHLLQLT